MTEAKDTFQDFIGYIFKFNYFTGFGFLDTSVNEAKLCVFTVYVIYSILSVMFLVLNLSMGFLYLFFHIASLQDVIVNMMVTLCLIQGLFRVVLIFYNKQRLVCLFNICNDMMNKIESMSLSKLRTECKKRCNVMCHIIIDSSMVTGCFFSIIPLVQSILSEQVTNYILLCEQNRN